MQKCRSCDAEIIWVKLEPTKNSSPINARPSTQGNIQLTKLGIAKVLAPKDAAGKKLDGEQLYLSHFATCPQAAEHRAKRRSEPRG